MKQLLTIVITALVSTFLSFFLFKSYFTEHLEANSAKASPVHLTSSELATIAESPILLEMVENEAPEEFEVSLPDNMANFTPIADRAASAVVNVNSYGLAGMRESAGSGVVISPDGYIVTNFHVIENGTRFQVTFSDKRQVEAEVVGKDPTTDLALLKVNARNLTALSYGNSDDVRTGEWVLAVGNPFNLTSTITAGIVSAKGRSINVLDDNYSIESFIQTDAVVNPGNSGGALVNVKGELIGINTAIMSESGGYAGYSFAIPANLVSKVMEDLKEYGHVRRALLGVNIREINADDASRLNLPGVRGVLISDVTEGGSAQRFGLQPGDVIFSVNNIDVNSIPELQEQVARLRPGDNLDVVYFRNGKTRRMNNIKLTGLADHSSLKRRHP